MQAPFDSESRHLARLALVAFLFTFTAARTLVFLIVSRRIPDLYLHLGGTHVHHLNYGIFLLSGVGALLFPASSRTCVVAAVLRRGLALTFDESACGFTCGNLLARARSTRSSHSRLLLVTFSGAPLPAPIAHCVGLAAAWSFPSSCRLIKYAAVCSCGFRSGLQHHFEASGPSVPLVTTSLGHCRIADAVPASYDARRAWHPCWLRFSSLNTPVLAVPRLAIRRLLRIWSSFSEQATVRIRKPGRGALTSLPELVHVTSAERRPGDT